MDEVGKILQNPIIRQGLMIAVPEIGLGIELAMTIVRGIMGSRKRSAKLLEVIDKELAKLIQQIATTKSKIYRDELEIRIHTLLGIINEWDKVR